MQGFGMGAADVVPGVSGGTMAFVFGIYEELIEAIRSFDLRTLRLIIARRWPELWRELPLLFLASLGAGILTAVFSLARGLEWMFENAPDKLYGFFFGLVAASVVSVWGRVERWDAPKAAAAFAAAVAAWWIVGLVPTQTPTTWWFFILSGAIAICAMILPGISGSFILLLLGKYREILAAVNDRDFGLLLLVMVGAALGLATFARLVSWLFRHFHDMTVAVLIGLMAGSLRKIWPWKEVLETTLDRHGQSIPLREANIAPPALLDPNVVAVIALAALGAALVLIIDRSSRRVTGSRTELA
jgi:putative membrane protein